MMSRPQEGDPAIATPDERPPAPPEAALIRRTRLASNPRVTAASLAPIAGITKGRWSQIEAGWEHREGTWTPARADDGTLAWMAYAVGIPPERLEAEAPARREAAQVLREILRTEKVSLDPADYPEGSFPRTVIGDTRITDADKRAILGYAALLARRAGRGLCGEP